MISRVSSFSTSLFSFLASAFFLNFYNRKAISLEAHKYWLVFKPVSGIVVLQPPPQFLCGNNNSHAVNYLHHDVLTITTKLHLMGGCFNHAIAFISVKFYLLESEFTIIGMPFAINTQSPRSPQDSKSQGCPTRETY